MLSRSMEDVNRLSGSLVDLLWATPRPLVPIDHSARSSVANRLVINVVGELASSTAADDDLSTIKLRLASDRDFRSHIVSTNKQVLKEFDQHYRKFGGRQALFAYILLMSIADDDEDEVIQAKLSLINWHAEQRRLDRSGLDGGIIAAWWPFDWFSQNFDAIAASVIASGLFQLGPNLLVDYVRSAFFEHMG